MTEFTSKLTKEDWIGFNRIYGKYTFKKFFWVSMIILFLIILKQVYSLIRYVWLIQAYLGILDSHILVSMIGKLILYLFMTTIPIGVYFFRTPLAAKRMLKHPENSKMLAERKVMFDDACIQIFIEKNEFKYAWESIIKIFETNDYVALFLTRNQCLLFSKNTDNAANVKELLHMLHKHCSETSIWLS
jgi:hypothetical protein